MRSFALALVLTASFLASAPCLADEKAPFGLSWGLSKKQVEALGVKLDESSDDANGKSFGAKSLPKVLSDISAVLLSFGFNDKLFRVAAASETIKNEPYGTKIKRRYEALKNILTKKYGPGETRHSVGKHYEGKNFLFGIKSGNSWYYTNFSTNVLSIQLGIRATGLSDGHYVLFYENKILKKDVKKQAKEKEKDAL